MNFEEWKRRTLLKLTRGDRSKKGNIDEEIKPLLELINASPDFYTTSSCAGRILLVKAPASGKKCDAEWLYASHQKVHLEHIMQALSSPPQELVNFKMEAPIIHVCARSIDRAGELITSAQAVGFKHSAILSINKRVMIEILGNEYLLSPVALKGQLVITSAYLSLLITIANNKLMKERKKIENFKSFLEQHNH